METGGRRRGGGVRRSSSDAARFRETLLDRFIRSAGEEGDNTGQSARRGELTGYKHKHTHERERMRERAREK